MYKHFLKSTFRNLLKKRSFSLINILGLAVGMAASIVISYYVLFENSFESRLNNADNLYNLHLVRTFEGQSNLSVTVPTAFKASADDLTVIEKTARLINIDYQNNSLINKGVDEIRVFEEKDVFFTDPEIIELLELKVIAGSTTDFELPYKMLIPSSIALKLFGDDDPIGKDVLVSGNIGNYTYQVIGVFEDLPKNSSFNFNTLLSINTLPTIEGENVLNSWNNFRSELVFSKNSGISEEEIINEMNSQILSNEFLLVLLKIGKQAFRILEIFT